MMVDIVLLDDLTDREMDILRFVAAGLSNQAIAKRLNISAETVKWHNKHVFSKLSAKNRTQAVAHARRLGVLVEDAHINNLPQLLTPFVGRAQELQQLVEFLENPELPLITLVGVGGVGKTRLAIEAAQRSARRFSNGVLFVPLITLTEPGRLLPFIGEQLQIHFEGHSANEQVLNYLRNKQMLLVLDTFEHLLAAATQVADIVQNAPHVTVMVTSRERLNLQNETTFVTRGMSLSAHGAQHSEAIQLFLETAHRQHHTLEFHDAEMARIARICQLVEGMPLAIELAAAWIQALTPGDILQHIQESFDHLKTNLRDIPPHLRSIRAVFERSWKLLTPEEQAAYVRLTIFAGPFTLVAAEAITGIDADMLRRLIDKSLIQHTPQRMYDFHELLHQYASQKLEESDTLREAHSRYYLEQLATYTPRLKGNEQLATCERIEAELANIHTAWQRAVKQRNLALIQRADEALFLYYVARGKFEEGVQKFRDVMDRLDARFFARYLFLLIGYGIPEGEMQTVSAQVAQYDLESSDYGGGFGLFTLGRYMQNVGDYPDAITYLEKALSHADDFYAAWIKGQLMACHSYLGQQSEADARSKESLQIATRLDNPFLMIWALNQRASQICTAGHYVECEALFRQMVDRATTLRMERHRARGTAVQALLAALRGDMAQARILAQKSRTIVRQTTSTEARVYVLATAGIVAAINGDANSARVLCQQSLSQEVSSIGILLAHLGLALVYCDFQDYVEARQQSLTYLRASIQMKGDGQITWGLPPAAVALGNLGRSAEAAEVLALAYTHPASATGWLDEWALLGEFRRQLENDLGNEAFSAAWERGKSLTFDAVQDILSNT